MDFSLTENHREVEALAKQLLSEIASEERHRELDKLDDRFDAKAWKVLGESGLLAVWLDEAHGGAGMSLIEWAAIAEAVGRRAAAIRLLSRHEGRSGLSAARHQTGRSRLNLLEQCCRGRRDAP